MTNAIKMLLQMQNGFLQLESTLCRKTFDTNLRMYNTYTFPINFQ
jgi:hypothetical protein